MVKNLPTVWETWVGKIPWSGKWHPTPVFLPGEFPGQRNLAGYIQSMGSQESDTTQQRNHHHYLMSYKKFSSVPTFALFVLL